MDPRFLSPCQNKSKPNISQNYAKSLLSFENIVEKELKSMKCTSDVSENSRKKFPSFSDQDEGFFDRSSTSPCFDDGKPKPVK